ncbi:BRCA1-associated RING domain protein 1 [Pelodytes ibericus]
MPLSLRSGNCPVETDRSDPAVSQINWSRTRAALRDMDAMLQCSKCMFMLKEPVCLGGCEHVFCRACAGEDIGHECPLCHTPAWVRDIQINRQLDTIIQLCGKLGNLLDAKKPEENNMDLCQEASLKLKTTPGGGNKKKQMKMRFSPRSRKLRCIFESERNDKQIPSTSELNPLFSSYEFVSSSPIQKSVKKKTTSKNKKTKKKKLEDINQEWGFGKQNQDGNGFKESKNSSRTVSFTTSTDKRQTPDNGIETESQFVPLKEKIQETDIRELEESVQSKCKTMSPSAAKCGDVNVSFKSPKSNPKITPVKRKSDQSISPVSSASKRPKRGRVKDPHKEENIQTPIPKEPSTMARRSRQTARILKDDDHSIGDAGEVEAQYKSPSSRSSHSRADAKTGHNGTLVQVSPNTFPSAKKNHKGETMLHVASIKGDLQGVEDLLKSGANPNVKDNAGWTPLHEACNHGHTKVVELLLQHQVRVNTAGYQNDTPLHDASRNGHAAIVQLLLNHGASPDAVNIFGLRPVDYAETEEIKSVFLQTPTNKEPPGIRPCPIRSPCRQGEETIALIASGLTILQRNDLRKLASLLKTNISSEYNGTVTHVIVSDEPSLRTMKCMMGTLAGCWILPFSWVKDCLKSRAREPEDKYEIHSGPHRARLNREQLLPKLLDGCHFYFLGCFKEHCKDDLIELVKAAGGQILIRQPKPDSDVTQTINTVAYHARADSDQRFCTQYILYDKASKYQPARVRQGKVWFAPSHWLIECITCFQLLPVPQ